MPTPEHYSTTRPFRSEHANFTPQPVFADLIELRASTAQVCSWRIQLIVPEKLVRAPVVITFLVDARTAVFAIIIRMVNGVSGTERKK